MNASGPIARPWFEGLNVRRRISLGLFAMVSLVLIGAMAAALTAARSRDAVLEFQQRTVPALEQAASLARLGVALDAAIRVLVAAESQFELDAAVFRLRRLSDELRTGLAELPPSLRGQAEVPRLLELADEFDQMLAEIAPVAGDLINNRGSHQARVLQIQSAAADWESRLTGAAANQSFAADEVLRSARITELAAAALATDEPKLARRLQVELTDELKHWQQAAATGDRLAILVMDSVRAAGLDEASPHDLRLQQLRLEFRLRQSQERALALLAGIGTQADALAEAVRTQVVQQVATSRARAKFIFSGLGLIALGSVIAALLIRRDLSRKVIHRLERLRSTMRAQVDGTGGVIEVDGDDEIAEMAQSVAHFADEISRREESSRSAHRDLINTQQQLVQQEKMAALGTLTAGVAHEINNPTNFADGAVQQIVISLDRLHEFLRHLAGDDASPEVLQAIADRFTHLGEMTATAHEGHERIKRIVRDLRQFSRLDEADRKSVPIADPIQSTVNLIRTRFDRVRFDLDLDFNPSIDCQPAKLGQVFMNLIMNACEAIADCHDGRDGVVGIATSAVTGSVRIDVTDNGYGIDESTRQRVFEPFFTTKPVGAGTGLGLSIVFGIIKDHGGTIEVTSTPGAGTHFIVQLPLQPPSSN